MLIEAQRANKGLDGRMSVKEKLDVKLINVPPSKEIVCETIREVTARHLNKYIIIYGTVVRTGNVNSRELTKKFCCKLCGREYICESEIADYSSFRLPVRCES